MKQALEHPSLPREVNGLVRELTQLFSEYGFRLNRLLPKDGSEVMTGALVEKRAVLTYGASIATDATLGNHFVITATNGTAFTIANPTGLVDGQRVTYTIRNTSGGALGVVTWGTTFKLAAWVSPGNANSRSITFRYDGTNLVEISRTAADVPN